MNVRFRAAPLILLFLFLFLLPAAACRRPVSLPLDQPVDVRVDTPVRFRDSDLDLIFRRVASDSRCPKNVQCVSAGEAVIALEGRILKGPIEPFEATVPGERADTDTAKAAVYDGYRIWVVRLEPYPVAGATTDTTSYVATLIVRKR